VEAYQTCHNEVRAAVNEVDIFRMQEVEREYAEPEGDEGEEE
jgi:hypothetical protein